MLRKKEKQTLTRLFLLGVGAPIGLDRFYEGDLTGGFLAILGFLIALITVVGLLVWIFPLISKTFRLFRLFEFCTRVRKQIVRLRFKQSEHRPHWNYPRDFSAVEAFSLR